MATLLTKLLAVLQNSNEFVTNGQFNCLHHPYWIDLTQDRLHEKFDMRFQMRRIDRQQINLIYHFGRCHDVSGCSPVVAQIAKRAAPSRANRLLLGNVRGTPKTVAITQPISRSRSAADCDQAVECRPCFAQGLIAVAQTNATPSKTACVMSSTWWPSKYRQTRRECQHHCGCAFPDK